MKKLLYLGIVLMLASCGSDESESSASTVNVDGKEFSTIKIGDLEVMTEDLGEMNWEEAVKACADLGDGWRLPTIDELNFFYENKDEIGGLTYEKEDGSEDTGKYYWSSTYIDDDNVWFKGFVYANQSVDPKTSSLYVRAVRTLDGSNESESSSNESESSSSAEDAVIYLNGKEISILKLGELEVMSADLGRMHWESASLKNSRVEKNMEGWRLPTKDELNILYANKDEIGGFADKGYWSSMEDDNGIGWQQNFGDGFLSSNNRYFEGCLRVVRPLESESATALWVANESKKYPTPTFRPSPIFIDGVAIPIVKIGDLEVMTEDLLYLNWNEAILTCEKLGDGWRLPTMDELRLLFKNKDKIGTLEGFAFWSSEELESNCWLMQMKTGEGFLTPGGEGFTAPKELEFFARAVRSI